MTDASVVMGNNTGTIFGNVMAPRRQLRVDLGMVGAVSLDPIAPITLRAEYQHTVKDNSHSNLALGSLVYSKPSSPVSVSMSAGKLFAQKKSTFIGVMAIDYYF
jgi:hypothetical protein